MVACPRESAGDLSGSNCCARVRADACVVSDSCASAGDMFVWRMRMEEAHQASSHTCHSSCVQDIRSLVSTRDAETEHL